MKPQLCLAKSELREEITVAPLERDVFNARFSIVCFKMMHKDLVLI